ncbi:unnamed protein product [Ectocarpus sp. 13 AM-2016]
MDEVGGREEHEGGSRRNLGRLLRHARFCTALGAGMRQADGAALRPPTRPPADDEPLPLKRSREPDQRPRSAGNRDSPLAVPTRRGPRYSRPRHPHPAAPRPRDGLDVRPRYCPPGGSSHHYYPDTRPR